MIIFEDGDSSSTYELRNYWFSDQGLGYLCALKRSKMCTACRSLSEHAEVLSGRLWRYTNDFFSPLMIFFRQFWIVFATGEIGDSQFEHWSYVDVDTGT
jgi:hypothetical protein